MSVDLTSTVKTFLLVHGAWYGRWCWYKLIPLLEQKGYQVVAIDLPGYGEDNRDPANITMDDYVQKVVEAAATVAGKVCTGGAFNGWCHYFAGFGSAGPGKRLTSWYSWMHFCYGMQNQYLTRPKR